ncbi:hypothetical protein AB6A40_009811 [Gnathostoma spinigerum]|uniref:Major sperm protein n=1 Tax=Gnathostoma spinigerum TaxID=75299 RepID=A0ABD6F1B7_9BILA
MDELAKCLPSQSMNGDVAANASVPNGDTHEANINTHIIDLSSKRSVKFEGDGDTTATATTVKIAPRSSSLSRRGSMIPNSLRPLAETRAAAPDDECFISNSLRISPKDELVLCQVEGENDWVDIVVLENRGSKTIVYKVKTTSREKFRVRPTTGSIAPGSTEFVRVYLQNEYKNQFGRDRFLLLAVEVDDPNSGEFSTLWKDAADSAKVERKLQCRIANSPRRTSSASCSSMPPIKKAESDEQTLSVRQDMLSLLWQQRILFICFAVLFVFHFQALIFQRSYYNYLIEKIQNVKCDCQCPAAPPSPSSPNINDYHSEL